MRITHSVTTICLACVPACAGSAALLAFPSAVHAQHVNAVPRPDAPARVDADVPSDWTWWTSGRYRITPGDVIQLTFLYVPEFDQTVSVQPDGYVSLRGLRDLYAQGFTIPEFQRTLVEEYATVLRDPVVSVVLKEFEKPYFVAMGEVARPGKFELRGATTVTQALAFAGGMTRAAKSSQVIVFRRFSNEYLEVKTINTKKMFRSRDLSEDVILRPGDTVFVPVSAMSQLGSFIPRPSLGLYVDPFGWFR
jgi:polysaccharide export outer membrane protein